MADTPSKLSVPVNLTETSTSVNSPSPEPQSPSKSPIFIVKAARHVRDYLGFKKTYNLTLWIIFGGALAGFSLSRFMLLDIHGVYRNNAAPGEYYLARTKPLFKICLILHLALVLPGGLLSVLQFVPLIRYRALFLHRINGYLVITLLALGTIPGFLLAPHAFGGHISTSSGAVVIGSATIISLAMAYYNIKVLQIDQHREWMLRAMVYMSAIITSRIVLVIGMSIMANSKAGPWEVWPCGQLEDLVRDDDMPKEEFLGKYPACRDGGYAMARAGNYGAEGFGSALRVSFGTSLWIAMLLHAVGVEIYIRLTAGESERLRMVSWERQMERGWSNAGSCGSTADHWGDATWSPDGKGTRERK